MKINWHGVLKTKILCTFLRKMKTGSSFLLIPNLIFRRGVKKLIKYYDEIYSIHRLISKAFTFIIIMSAFGTAVEMISTAFFIHEYESFNNTFLKKYGFMNLTWFISCFYESFTIILLIRNVKKKGIKLSDLVFTKFKSTDCQKEKIEVK